MSKNKWKLKNFYTRYFKTIRSKYRIPSFNRLMILGGLNTFLNNNPKGINIKSKQGIEKKRIKKEIIEKKTIKVEKVRIENGKIIWEKERYIDDMIRLQRMYNIFIGDRLKHDRNKIEDLNFIKETEEKKNSTEFILGTDFNKYKKNHINNQYKVEYENTVQIFNTLPTQLNNKGKLTKINETGIENFVQEYSGFLKSRTLSKNIIKPHYFFPTKYNEKAKPTQIRHWNSSIYNFTSRDKANSNFRDNYTIKLIKLFFNVKFLKKRWMSDLNLIKGFKIKLNENIIDDINSIINYTSNRTNLISIISYGFTPLFLKLDWIKEQLNITTTIGRIIERRKLNFFTGFYPKRKSYLRKLSRVLLSKPLFKHTSLNLIIDLFIYNNKRYKFKRIENLTVRRSIYKFMYSMYLDYSKKIKQTINRPRFFYMNLLEPKIYNYYSSIIKYYDYYLIRNNKSLLIYLSFLALQLNFVAKKKFNYIKNSFLNNTSINSLRKKFFNGSIIIRDSNSHNIHNSNIDYICNNITRKTDNSSITNIIYETENKNLFTNSFMRKTNNKLLYYLPFNIYKLNKANIYNANKSLIKKDNFNIVSVDKKKNKYTEEKYSKYNKLRKYIQELEKKSNQPIDLNSFPLWNKLIVSSNKVNNKNILKGNYNNRTSSSFKKNLIKNNPVSMYYKDRKAYNNKSGNLKRWYKTKDKIIEKYGLHDPDTRYRFSYGVVLPREEFQGQIFDFNKHVLKPHDFQKRKINIKEVNEKYNNKNIISSSNNILSDNILNNIKKIRYEQLNDINNNLFDNPPVSIKVENKNINDNNINKHNIYENDINSVETKSIHQTWINKLVSRFYMEVVDKKKILENINDNNKYLYKDLFFNNKTNFNDNYIKLNINNEININNNNINFGNNLKKNEKIRKINALIRMNVFNKNNVNYNNFETKSNILWNNLDSSILYVLSQYIEINKTELDNISYSHFNYFFDKMREFKGYGNFWFTLYFLSVIKKEYSKVYNDIILTKDFNIIPYQYDIVYRNKYINNESIDNSIFTVDKNTGDEIVFRCWPNLNYFDNNNYNEYDYQYTDNVINNNLNKGYNEKLFKPYYRSIISYSIITTYLKLLRSLRKYSSTFFMGNLSNNWLKGFINIDYNVYNFVTVKVLLDIFRYNYRSLIRVKPKFYFINIFRKYKAKLDRLNINTWVNSLNYIRKLRKTPNNFWLRYHRLAYTFSKKIIIASKLDTKHNVLIPFVIYFEDILYTIYGKWVLIRLWPLKRYYLSSYILARRVLTLILWRKKFMKSKYNFQRMITKLIAGIKVLRIKKVYLLYAYNSNHWPNNILTIFNHHSYGKLNYLDLQSYDKKQNRYHKLETYSVPEYNLFETLSNLNNNYLLTYQNYYSSIKKFSTKRKLKRKKITNLQFVLYWLRPLKNYIISFNKCFDITGLKLILSGRAGKKRNNLRSIYKKRMYGNLIGAFHTNPTNDKKYSFTISNLRGQMKYNIDYSQYTSKNINGAITLKVWISSRLSTDLRELLLHLVKIKYIYSQLIYRMYIVTPYFTYMKSHFNYILPNEKYNKKYKKYTPKFFSKKFKFYNSKRKFNYSKNIKNIKLPINK